MKIRKSKLLSLLLVIALLMGLMPVLAMPALATPDIDSISLSLPPEDMTGETHGMWNVDGDSGITADMLKYAVSIEFTMPRIPGADVWAVGNLQLYIGEWNDLGELTYDDEKGMYTYTFTSKDRSMFNPEGIAFIAGEGWWTGITWASLGVTNVELFFSDVCPDCENADCECCFVCGTYPCECACKICGKDPCECPCDDCGKLPCVCPPSGSGESIEMPVFEGRFVSIEGWWNNDNTIGRPDSGYGFAQMDLDLLEMPEAKLIIEHTGEIQSITTRSSTNWSSGGSVPRSDESTAGVTIFTGEDIIGAHWATFGNGDSVEYMHFEGGGPAAAYTVTKVTFVYLDLVVSPDSIVTGVEMNNKGRTAYSLGGQLDLSRTTINLTLQSGKIARNIPVTPDMIVGFTTAVRGERPITVVYPNIEATIAFTTSYDINVTGFLRFTAANRPFPQAANNSSLAMELLKPAGVSQEQMNQDIIDKFKYMIGDFIIDPATATDPNNFRMVLDHGSPPFTDAPPSGSQTTCSESMGYGMLALALMAGADSEVGIDIKAYFDGMFRSLRYWLADDPRAPASYLMAWEVVNDSQWKTHHGNNTWRAPAEMYSVSSATTASDGSLDMAYALILASQQWETSNDGVNYLEYAKKMIDEIWQLEVNEVNGTYFLNRGSWDDSGMYTRPSDHMMYHLKVFAELDPVNPWNELIGNTYAGLLNIISQQETPNGLLPDFVSISDDGVWSASEPFSLESVSDGDYHWNACRVPWRLGVDTMFSGTTPMTELAVRHLNELQFAWADGDFDNIFGRQLNGVANIVENGYSYDVRGSAFSGPALIPAAMFGPQEWFDAGWAWAADLPWQNNKYGDFILVLSMIAASGNEWSPLSSVSPSDD